MSPRTSFARTSMGPRLPATAPAQTHGRLPVRQCTGPCGASLALVFGVIIPVGPGDRELLRLTAVLGELARHERREDIALCVVDDAPAARLIAPDWPGAQVIRTTLRERARPDLFSAHVAGTLEGLAHLRSRGVAFAVKLDTDVAIINGFSAQLREAFADPSLGVVGSYDRTSSGGTRDWTLWRKELDAVDRPFALRRRGRGVRVIYRRPAQRQFLTATRAAAYAVAPPGAHCLGGAYGVSGAFLASAELDWRPWVGSGLGEDVTVGLLSSAAGLRMQSLTGPGEPFALAWRGLPGTPAEIAAAGHAIVHSVKADSADAEQAIRDQLQAAPQAG